MKMSSKKDKLCPTCGVNLTKLDRSIGEVRRTWKAHMKDIQELMACVKRCFYLDVKSFPFSSDHPEQNSERQKILAGWDDFRTAPWATILESPEVTARQVKQLLAIAA